MNTVIQQLEEFSKSLSNLDCKVEIKNIGKGVTVIGEELDLPVLLSKLDENAVCSNLLNRWHVCNRMSICTGRKRICIQIGSMTLSNEGCIPIHDWSKEQKDEFMSLVSWVIAKRGELNEV